MEHGFALQRLGEALRAIRVAARWTMNDAARWLGSTVTEISNAELGFKWPQEAHLELMIMWIGTLEQKIDLSKPIRE